MMLDKKVVGLEKSQYQSMTNPVFMFVDSYHISVVSFQKIPSTPKIRKVDSQIINFFVVVCSFIKKKESYTDS